MFAHFPDKLKQQILSYLEARDFRAAKELRDNYLLSRDEEKVVFEDQKINSELFQSA